MDQNYQKNTTLAKGTDLFDTLYPIRSLLLPLFLFW